MKYNTYFTGRNADKTRQSDCVWANAQCLSMDKVQAGLAALPEVEREREGTAKQPGSFARGSWSRLDKGG